jgi:hypothetical protein
MYKRKAYNKSPMIEKELKEERSHRLSIGMPINSKKGKRSFN